MKAFVAAMAAGVLVTWAAAPAIESPPEPAAVQQL